MPPVPSEKQHIAVAQAWEHVWLLKWPPSMGRATEHIILSAPALWGSGKPFKALLSDSCLADVNEMPHPGSCRRAPPVPPTSRRLPPSVVEAQGQGGLIKAFLPPSRSLLQERNHWLFARNHVLSALPRLPLLNWSEALRSLGMERKAGGGRRPRQLRLNGPLSASLKSLYKSLDNGSSSREPVFGELG